MVISNKPIAKTTELRS